ncbi:Tyrocidine synthase III [Gammaproteobacteria bacterium MOLA455]|nr:Tyrocidine synthase III [Gammaproteobacteria bacterium MOLA455]
MKCSVIDYLGETCDRNAEAVAIEDDAGCIKFSELSQMAAEIAYCISGFNLANSPIAVYLPKTKMSVVSFIGVLLSGNFYVPLDIKSPTSRISKILGNLDCKVIISDRNSYSDLDNLESNASVVLIDEVIESMNEISRFHEFKSLLSNKIDADPAYCIFTSGSTGTPKGVLISHRSIIDYIEWAIDTYDISSDDVIGNQAPFYFDNSTLDIYLMLAVGARLVIIPEEKFTYPIKLIEYLNVRMISFIFWVPSVLVNVANLKVFSDIKPTFLSKILFAGEVMPTKHLNYWRRAMPEALFSNLYGPTEITVDCTFYIVDREFADDDILPIGKACRNSDVFLLSADDAAVEDGSVGEICVRGASLALGYFNNGNQTDAAFVKNPLNNSYKEFIYKTGDLGYINEFGEFIYTGRKDNQVKHLGYRIELGEIESAIVGLNGIDNACVIYLHEEKKIIAFYCGELDIKGVRKEIVSRIPRYMIPWKWIKFDVLPLNQNGKIDRLSLEKNYYDSI